MGHVQGLGDLTVDGPGLDAGLVPELPGVLRGPAEEALDAEGLAVLHEGQLSHLVPAVRDGQGAAQILRCAPADLAGQLVQRVQRLSHQPVDEKQAGGQDCGHGQQTLEMENPSGLSDGLAGLQFHHGQTGSCACRRILGREDGHGLHGVGHLDGRQIIGQGQQEAAEREQDCAEQGEPQAQGHGLFHTCSSPARR